MSTGSKAIRFPPRLLLIVALMVLAGAAGCDPALGPPDLVVEVPRPEIQVGPPGDEPLLPSPSDIGLPSDIRPPPGACQFWYPDRPAPVQPPPGACDVWVPPGAVLLGP